MDSSDYARVHGQIMREMEAFSDLSRAWAQRPETPRCSSPSALAWHSASEEIAGQIHQVGQLLAASRLRVHRAWMEALREENSRRFVGAAS